MYSKEFKVCAHVLLDLYFLEKVDIRNETLEKRFKEKLKDYTKNFSEEERKKFESLSGALDKIL